MDGKSLGVITNPDADKINGIPFGPGIMEIRTLSKKEYDNYVKAEADLKLINRKLELFKLVHFNYRDYIFEKKFHFENYKKTNHMNAAIMEHIMININRRIINYLTSIKTFIDHSEYDLKNKYGKTSKQYNSFKNLQSQKYDSHFAYRFLIKLRNYVQHCGLPLGNINISSEMINNDPNNIDFKFNITINRDTILNNFNWKKLEPEIKKLPPLFPINSYLKTMNEDIAELTFHLFGNDIKNAVRSAEIIKDLIREIDKQGMPCILDTKNMTRKGGNVKIEEFSLHLIGIVDYLNKYDNS